MAFEEALKDKVVPYPVRAIEGEEEPHNGLFDTLR